MINLSLPPPLSLSISLSQTHIHIHTLRCISLPFCIGARSILSSLVLALCRGGEVIASRACLKSPLAVSLSSLWLGVCPRVCSWLCMLTGAAIIDVLLLGTFWGLDLKVEEETNVCFELISRGCMTFSAKFSKEDWSLTSVRVRMYFIRSSYLLCKKKGTGRLYQKCTFTCSL